MTAREDIIDANVESRAAFVSFEQEEGMLHSVSNIIDSLLDAGSR